MHNVTLITGDGTGPELCEATRRCIDATGVKINWDVQPAGVDIMEKEGSFSNFLWQFVDGGPIQNSWRTLEEIPTETAESRAMSKALKKRGFSFVGPTIVYAFMQAVGMVNDHVVSCFRYQECKDISIN